MFAQCDWQDANRKRIREDEYEDIASGGTLGFTEHRSVRKLALACEEISFSIDMRVTNMRHAETDSGTASPDIRPI